MKRTPEGQSDHDKCVKSLATDWVKDGFTVKADLEDWGDKPTKIKGYIPDIIAKKGHLTRICEVETEDTIEIDEDQRTEFKRYALENNLVFFWLFLALKGGECRYQRIYI